MVIYMDWEGILSPYIYTKISFINNRIMIVVFSLISILIIVFSVYIGYYISSNCKDNKLKLIKAAQNLIKISTLTGTVLLTVHTGLDILFDIDDIFIPQAFGLCAAGTFVLIVSAYLFEFCRTFRLAIIYNFLVKECIILEDSTDFFNGWIYEAKLIMLFIGLCLSSTLIYRAIKKYRCNKTDE